MDAQYTFSSNARRGFQPAEAGRTTVGVAVEGAGSFARDVRLLAAGDVVGVPQRQVIRTYPIDGTANAEPNCLALVEFDTPDLPWMFSPPSAEGGRILPWLMLVVVDETVTGEQLSPSPIGTKLVTHTDQLPNPAEAWLWAHVQTLGEQTATADPSHSLSRLVCPRRLRSNRLYLACVVPTFDGTRVAGLGGEPGELRTRPKLAWEPNQGAVELPVFHSFRFSTGPGGDFESLVRRLRGVPLPPGTGTRRLTLDDEHSGLPEPQPAGADVDLQVALRPPGATSHRLEPYTGPDYVSALRARLADAGYDTSLLTAGGPRPIVGPPIYGQLAAGAGATAANLGSGSVPPWLSDLNLDPRMRVAAGLGAAVVRTDQDHYLERAWQQVGDVLAANRLRRRGEFSLAANRRLYTRWLMRLPAGDLLTTTAPLHAKIETIAGHQTLVGRLRASPLPSSVVSVEFRRQTRLRSFGSAPNAWQAGIGVAALAARAAEVEPLVERTTIDTIDRLDPPSTVWGVEGAAAIMRRWVPGDAPIDIEAAARLDTASRLVTLTMPDAAGAAAMVATSPSADRVLSRAGFVPMADLVRLAELSDDLPPPLFDPAIAFPAVTAPEELGPLLGPIVRLPDDRLALLPIGPILKTVPFDRQWITGETGDGIRMSLDASEIARSQRTGADAVAIAPGVFDQLVIGPVLVDIVPTADFDIPDALRSALDRDLADVVVGLAVAQVRSSDASDRGLIPLGSGFDGLRLSVLGALDPAVTIPRAVNSRITALLAEQFHQFGDIMAAPELSEPTYSALARISHDWLLPGIDHLPTDTTTLVEANQAFIAAFLVGMNHELARELLWHEYPTDLRGTYARQFWTHRRTTNPSDRFDLRRDLHDSRVLDLAGLTGLAHDPLVLVIKSDLVTRYPGLLVFAGHTRAEAEGGPRRLDDRPHRMVEPSFVGILAPDVLLVGFDSLTEEGVRSVAGEPNDEWWFFFAEHFAEPRFGFDELVRSGIQVGPEDERIPFDGPNRSWSDAGWQHASLSGGHLTTTSFTDSLPRRPGTLEAHRWAESAATQAWITLQFPYRRGMRATRLLPRQGEP